MLNYDDIPEELRWFKSWAVAGLDEKGTYKAPYTSNGTSIFHTSPTDPSGWIDFETALDATVAHPPCGLGFILSDQDGYTCIDLDVKNVHNEPDPTKWTDQETINRHWNIVQKFNSYTEKSASGQGLHIWVKGNIGKGCKRDGVEVYSRQRFIVCTGDVIINEQIHNRQELLDILVSEIQNVEAPKITLVDIEETESDEVILERARTAENGAKYQWLYEGNWQGEYKSQSEADLALMSMYTFYTKSNAQIRRLFRTSELGKREKAVKDNRYLDLTLTLIRSRQAQELEDDEASKAAAKQFAEQLVATYRKAQQPVTALQIAEVGTPPLAIAPPLAMHPLTEPQNKDSEGLSWPPGLLGELAKYVYHSSPRPVKEVSIVAALGLMAGICGKTFIIGNNGLSSGLNIYLILVGRSAIGKEAMHSGIANIMSFVRNTIPAGMDFCDFTDYASGPGLSKAVAANPSFVNIASEWGRKLQRLATEDRGDGPMQQLRTVMTSLYQKSGPTSIVGGIGYSDKDKNIASVSGVAYSMIGETTPGRFYDSLTENMMEDGFLSRFTIIEFVGDRPPSNPNPQKTLDPLVLDTLLGLISHSISMIQNFQYLEVLSSQKAKDLLDEFDRECDAQVNRSDEEGWRQMWNRAHLKVCRIAALLAVADNHSYPVTQSIHVIWALEVVRRDIAVMRRRINSGDVGVGDSSREKKLLSLMHTYLLEEPSASYQIPEGMRKDGVIPRKFLQISTQKASSFTSHKNGQVAALDATLKSMVASGYIVEVEKGALQKTYGFQGQCYRIINLPLSNQEQKELNAVRAK